MRAFGPYGHPTGLETDDHRAVPVGAEHAGARGCEAIERGLGGMPIRVPGTCRRDGDRGSHRVDERLRRCRPAAVMRDLEEVDVWQALGQERRVDPFFDIAHQQEPAHPDVTEEHHRHVVDARPAIGRRRRDLTADRPEDPQVDLVHGQSITGGDREPDRGARCG